MLPTNRTMPLFEQAQRVAGHSSRILDRIEYLQSHRINQGDLLQFQTNMAQELRALEALIQDNETNGLLEECRRQYKNEAVDLTAGFQDLKQRCEQISSFIDGIAAKDAEAKYTVFTVKDPSAAIPEIENIPMDEGLETQFKTELLSLKAAYAPKGLK